jgi:hypothetical protein
MRVNFSEHGDGNRKLKFITTLIRLFAADNDIRFGDNLKTYICTPQGSKELAKWAEKAGYKISYWSMDPIKLNNGHPDSNFDNDEFTNPSQIRWFGFGIDIDETCPKIIELKLINS